MMIEVGIFMLILHKGIDINKHTTDYTYLNNSLYFVYHKHDQ
jgi:hypothetical protein